jgi:hypothetical protein
VLIPLLRDGRGRIRARFGVNVDIGCLRRGYFIDKVRIIVLVLSARYARARMGLDATRRSAC